MTISEYFQKVGGVKPFADAMNLPTTTVYSWVCRGKLPATRIMQAFTYAHQRGVDAGLADIVVMTTQHGDLL